MNNSFPLKLVINGLGQLPWQRHWLQNGGQTVFRPSAQYSLPPSTHLVSPEEGGPVQAIGEDEGLGALREGSVLSQVAPYNTYRQ